MTNDTEQEVKLQFLEEAQDYLDAIETALLGLKQGNFNEHLLSALRAAHSVKGGSAMMGFFTLSQAAHRFEDSLKTLKSDKPEITPELEQLLLAGLDGLQQISNHNRALEGQEQVPDWLDTQLIPVFDRLRELLGEPSPEDEAVILAESEGQDLATLMFETEVEARLLELEEALSTPDELNLRETFVNTANDLAGVAEMLELQSFGLLCSSISQQIETAPPQDFHTLAQQALQAWKRARALVLAGQSQLLPTELIVDLGAAPSTPELEQVFGAVTPDISIETELELAATSNSAVSEEVLSERDGSSEDTEDLFASMAAATTEEVDEEAVIEETMGIDMLAAHSDSQVVEDIPESLDWLDDLTAEEANTASPAIENEMAAIDLQADLVFADIGTTSSAPEVAEPVALPVLEAAQIAHSRESQPLRKVPIKTSDRKTADRTVRVTIDKLDRINDLFGEFSIERNSMSLHLRRLQNLFGNLGGRVKFMEQLRLSLRTAYDKASAMPALATVGATATAAHSSLGQNGFDSLEMDRYTELHLVSQELMETIVQVEEIISDVELSLQEANLANNDINRTSKLLQTSLTSLRMRPFQDLVSRFPRAVRDLSLKHGKDVQLSIQGGGTLFERAVLEVLGDPLMHLLRNAFDHGIEAPELRRKLGKPEQGTIEIRAQSRSNSTVIAIRDDGQGIDLDKVRQRMRKMGYAQADIDGANRAQLLDVIFEPGFSTADRVTDLSGRGIGMDVVRSNLQRIRGNISVETELGVGTTFTLDVPISLSSVRILMAESAGMLIAFPLDTIDEILLLDSEPGIDSSSSQVLNWDGYALPIIPMGQLVHFQRTQPPVDMETAPILNTPAALVMVQDRDAIAIQIDRHWGEQEIVVRQIEGTLPLPNGFSGCTILGDGQVVPLADASAIFQLIRGETPQAGLTPTSEGIEVEREAGDIDEISTSPMSSRKAVLVVDDSTNVRRFLALTLAKAGYQPEQAKDGQDALEKLRAGLDVQAVICDIEMPRLDGFGFLAHVRADPSLAKLPVAMLTSRSGNKHRSLAMELGATAYFTKPYQEFDLLQKLAQLVGSNR